MFYLADVFLSDYDNGRDLSLFEKEGIDLQKFYNLSVEMKNLYLFPKFLLSISTSFGERLALRHL